MAKEVILAGLARALIFSVCSSMRLSAKDHRKHEVLKKKYGNFIYAFWHGRLLMLIHNLRYRGIGIMISTSEDGEIIARATEKFGHICSRGSSTRGGLRGLIHLKKIMEKGYAGAFAVDGPRGPAREVKEGVIYLAAKTGFPIIPLTSSAKPAVTFSSWDSFMAPLPFSKGAVLVGDPIYVKPGDDFSKKALEVKAGIDRITARADDIVK